MGEIDYNEIGKRVVKYLGENARTHKHDNIEYKLTWAINPEPNKGNEWWWDVRCIVHHDHNKIFSIKWECDSRTSHCRNGLPYDELHVAYGEDEMKKEESRWNLRNVFCTDIRRKYIEPAFTAIREKYAGQ